MTDTFCLQIKALSSVSGVRRSKFCLDWIFMTMTRINTVTKTDPSPRIRLLPVHICFSKPCRGAPGHQGDLGRLGSAQRLSSLCWHLPQVSIDFACFHRFLLSLQRWARDATVGAEGCPIGVQVCITENSNHLETFLLKMVFMQVVGRHFQEEMVIHAMKTIEELLKRKM